MAFTIRFLNYDGTELESQQVESGVVPTYTGETPTKAPDTHYTYSFDGWDPEVVAAEADADYTAVFESTVIEFTIRFLNDDGTVLESVQVEEGEMPAYSGETPTKDPDAQYTYTFAGWDPEIVVAEADADYTAVYDSTVNQYSITFVDDDGTTVLKEATEYEYGTPVNQIEVPPNPHKDATDQYTYVFTGWSPELAEVTEDVVYKAVYASEVNKYEITFMDDCGNVVQKTMVDYGETPEEPSIEKDCCSLAWSPTIVSVVGDATYTAVFTKEAEVIREDHSMGEEYRWGLFMVPSESSLSYLPDWASTGSVAVMINDEDGEGMWVKSLEGDWIEANSLPYLLIMR